jgi:hypothetical protein
VALRRLEGATAHQEAGAEACEHRAVALRVLLVALGVVHVHAGDPVALGHGGSRCCWDGSIERRAQAGLA